MFWPCRRGPSWRAISAEKGDRSRVRDAC